MNKLIAKIKSVPFRILVWGIITGYIVGLLGWIALCYEDISKLWVKNEWTLRPTVIVFLTLVYFLVILVYGKKEDQKLTERRLKIISGISLGGLILQAMPVNIPTDNVFSFLNMFHEKIWGLLAGIWAWVIGWSIAVQCDFSGRKRGKTSPESPHQTVAMRAKEGKPEKKPITEHIKAIYYCNRVFCWIIAIFIVAYVAHGFYLYNNLILNAFDFAIYDHTLWRLAYDFSPANSVNGFGNSFGAHFQPLVIVLAPFYWLWNSPKMLIILEVLIVASGAIPVYRMSARRFGKSFLTYALVLSYLFFIGNGATLAFHFHPSTMLAPVMLAAYDFFDEKRWKWHFIFIFLALMVKENAGLYVAGLGLLFLLVERKYWKIGLGYITLGLGWVLVETKLILPMIGHRKYHYFYYQELGLNPMKALETVIRNPLYSLRVFFDENVKVNTFLSSLLGVGFLAILSPYFILALPNLGERLFASKDTMNSLWGHYGAPLSFGLMVATIKSIEIWGKKFGDKKEMFYRAAAAALILGTILTNKTYKPFINSWPAGRIHAYAENDILWEGLKLIPEDASVSAQTAVVPRIAHRKEIFVYPAVRDDAKYLVLTLDGQKGRMVKDQYPQLIKEHLNDKNLGLIFSKGGVLVFKRGEMDRVKVSERVRKYVGQVK